MSEEPWTIKRLLDWTSGFFQKHGIEKPQLEAAILLAHALKIKRIELYTAYESEPTESQRAVYRDFVNRRKNGEPTAYLTGTKEFYSLPFKVNSSVLIPRPETEDLVIQTLDAVTAKTRKHFSGKVSPESAPQKTEWTIADVGTGCGIIAITLAKHLPKQIDSVEISANIIAVDISPEALDVARSNAEMHGVLEQIDFRQSDLLDGITEELDIVVSNPPYVSQSEYDALPMHVKNFEPQTALLAGINGTETIEQLIEQSSVRLRSGGTLLMEVSPMIAEAVTSLLQGWESVQVFADSMGRKRIVSAQKR